MKTTLQLQTIAVQNNYLFTETVDSSAPKNNQQAATILFNLNFFGYMPSTELFEILSRMPSDVLEKWWETTSNVLENTTGVSRDVSSHMVYKNFPQEVLSMSESEYKIKQLFIYFGVPVELLREDEQERPEMVEKVDYKVLQVAPKTFLEDKYASLKSQSTKWTLSDKNQATFLFDHFSTPIDFHEFSFNDNAVQLAALAVNKEIEIVVDTATNVLRLSLVLNTKIMETKVLSNDYVTELTINTPIKNIKFYSFSRKQRRSILALLDTNKTLFDDIKMKKGIWKKLFQRLNPSDYKLAYPRVFMAYDLIYNKKVVSMEAEFLNALKKGDVSAIEIAKSASSGFFLRNVHHMYKHFGELTFKAMVSILPDLSIEKLVKFEKYINTVNDRKNRLVTPKGNWSKLQILPANENKIKQEDIDFITKAISIELDSRLSKQYPNGVLVSSEVDKIKLKSNDLEIDLYGRGTEFSIPESTKSVRVFSFWEVESENIWFDCGLTFFNNEKTVSGLCDWDSQNATGSLFSGDPLPSKSKGGKNTQVVDLNIDELVANGHRYALWSIFSYNGLGFNEVKDVYGNMQFCEEPQAGEILEPSRSQLSFSLNGSSTSKYVAYLDLVERKVVFIDADISANTENVYSNTSWIAGTFKALTDYVTYQPSLKDVFKHLSVATEYVEGQELIVDGSKPLVGVSDKNITFVEDDKDKSAFLVHHTRESNQFDRLDIMNSLSVDETK